MRTLIIAGTVLALTMPAAYAQQAGKPGAPAQPAMTASKQLAKYQVFFDWDKYAVTPEARSVITKAAEEFKKTGTVRITATGHTDTSGSAEYNQKLSERRAVAVKNELVKLGVPAASIVTVGLGQKDLLVPTADGVREAKNRRVEIEFPTVVAAAPPPPPPAPMAAAAPPPPPPEPKAFVTLGPWYGHNLKEKDQANGQNQKSSDLLGPELRAGYNFTPTWAVYGDLAGYSTLGTSQDDGYGGRAALGFEHQWNLGKFHPSIGPKVGYIAGKGAQDSVFIGPELGLKYDVAEKMFIYARAAYDHTFRNDIGQGIINGGLGLGIRF